MSSSGSLSTFKFDEKLTDTLNELKETTSASSKSEVVRRAIALLKVVQDASNNGDEILLVHNSEGGERIQKQIILP